VPVKSCCAKLKNKLFLIKLLIYLYTYLQLQYTNLLRCISPCICDQRFRYTNFMSRTFLSITASNIRWGSRHSLSFPARLNWSNCTCHVLIIISQHIALACLKIRPRPHLSLRIVTYGTAKPQNNSTSGSPAASELQFRRPPEFLRPSLFTLAVVY
jgi:hypothetical protein